MCLFFLLRYFPAVITVQISQRTLITPMAISWELILKYQAKSIPERHVLVLPMHSQTNTQPSCQIAPSFPSSPQTRRCQRGPTPDPDTGSEEDIVPDEPGESQDAKVEDESSSA